MGIPGAARSSRRTCSTPSIPATHPRCRAPSSCRC